ncbi:MAG: bifunctional 4-hydroxy-2-oxoglutarate aldolase/2-dehydro-3-deoxy-phosphogluconate aldolase [Spirochaetales bacterium]|nr:bifunctional 4-hydroxy-2-oxoglutarate aldolase/2-dehydro-3-deoxy-phosphogluconate aldolase [Spirochaetales bacterium]
MARYSKLQVLTKMEETGLVPVFYNPDIETAKSILKACADGGAHTIEMTNRGDHAIDVFTELEKYAAKEFPELILGVGSIVDAPTAAMYIAHGACFIVGPCLDKETAFMCNKRNVPYMPGCGTATEIHEAQTLGVDICKIFPGRIVGGPEFVKAVRAPMPWTKIMPTGGVNPTAESIKEWFSSGISAAGIGSNLITKELMAKKDYTTMAANIKKTIEMIADVRRNMK